MPRWSRRISLDAIEGGAFLKGSIDIVREQNQEASHPLAASAGFKAGV